MSALRVLLSRLAALFASRRRDGELDQEIQHHLALLAAQYVRRGMSMDDACAAARREFGGIEQVKQSHREQRGFLWLGDLWSDTRYAARSLFRNPGFTSVVVLTLALGIGASSAIFSVVNGVLLKPLPYANAERLVQLMVTRPPAEGPTGLPLRTIVGLTAAQVGELRAQTRTLAAMGTYGPALMGLDGYEDAARLQGTVISAAVLQMLQVRPVLGRLLTPEDEAPGAEPVILIGYSAWRRFFGGSPEIIGRSLTFNSVLGPRRQSRHTVVGVMPEGFEFPLAQTQFWTPFRLTAAGGGAGVRGIMLGLLANGVSMAAASAELEPLARELRRGQRGNEEATYELVRVQNELVRPVRSALIVLSTAVGFLLLIACLNVSSLLVARTAVRRREMAIRTALGAGRGRVIRLVLAESLLLASLGAIAGLVFAAAGVRLLTSMADVALRFDLGTGLDFPRLNEVTLDGTVVLFTCAMAVLAGLLFGLAPAIRQTRYRTVDTLKEGSNATTSGAAAIGARRILVVTEIAAAMVLLVGAGLLVRSFANLSGAPTGYDADNVLTFQVGLPLNRFPDERLKAFAEDLVERLRSIPGVEAAAYANQLPLVQLEDRFPLRTSPAIPSPPLPPSATTPDARPVSRDFLAVLGTSVVAGRGFTDGDGAGQPRVVLINQQLARRDFPGENPIGRIVYIGPDEIPWQIVGIIEDVRQFGLAKEAGPQFFVDLRQWPAWGMLFPVGAYYAIRTTGTATGLVDAVRNATRQLEPQAVLFNVAPMTQLVSTTVVRPRLYTVLLTLFAAVGVALSVVGIYGVMAYSVAQRTREIGIRMALGARRTSVLMLVLRDSMLLTAFGIALGLAGATMLTRYLEGMLFGITALDAPTFAAVAVLFAVVATVAALAPARRATHVSPIVALRQE